ncbi:MAG: SsrA-binding protein SmpB [Candidatus Dormibacteria bacterium]
MPQRGGQQVAVNKKAYHDYFVVETVEAGIELVGTEVKSIRSGRANLRDGFVRIDRGEAWLENVHISQYESRGYADHAPTRSRRLLLHRREINSLLGKSRQKGLTLIPLRLYFNHNRLKLEVGLCKGKKEYDKRQDIAARDAKRDMDQALKQRLND